MLRNPSFSAPRKNGNESKAAPHCYTRIVKIDGHLADVDRPKLLQDAEGSARALKSRVAQRD